MKQRVKDGILLDNSFFIMEEKKEGFPYYMRILQFLVILAGGWSVISIWIESFAISVSMQTVWLGLLISAAVFYFLFFVQKLDLVKIIFAAGFYALFLYSRLGQLRNGFYVLENLVLDRMESYYNVHTYRFLADYAAAERDMTLLVVMTLIPIMALLSAAVIRSRYINFCNILLFMPVAASYAFGIVPSQLYLVTYILVMLYLTRSYLSCRHGANKEQKKLLQRINSRAAIWLTMICLGLFLMMKLFVSPAKYDGVTEINDAKQKLQTFLYSFSIADVTNKIGITKLPAGSTATGGLSGGELGNVDRVEFNQSKQLLITAPLSAVADGMYLKGYVGSDYTGTSWTGHDDAADAQYQKLLQKLPQDKFIPGNQSSEFISLISNVKNNTGYQYSVRQGTIKVNYLNANKSYLYTPYYTDYSDLKNMEYRDDLYAAPKKKRGSYELNFYYRFDATFREDTKTPQEVKDYSEYEKLYRDFVYDAYTRLPVNGLDRLKQEFSDAGKGLGTTMDKVKYVKDYLNANTRYSLSPGRLPAGKDFVEYFLYENKVGYCSHYASAAALMLRAMGVPARYVEGYAVGSLNINQDVNAGDQVTKIYTDTENSSLEIPQVELTVKDSDAHAWVEVYIDGSGWVPMEFTPSTSISDTDSAAEEMITAGGDADKPTVKPTTAPTATPEQPTKAPEVTKKADRPEEDITTAPTSAPAAPVLSGDEQKVKAFPWPGVILAAAAVCLAAVILLILRRKKMTVYENPNKRVLHIYAKIQRILSICRGLPKRGGYLEDNEDYVKENCSYIDEEAFDSFMETVRKARFGKYLISPEELKQAEHFHRELSGKAYQRSRFLKKLYLKLIL